MLYKVFMADSFAELQDRIGVIEAVSIHEATQCLLHWNKDNWGEYTPSKPEVKVEPDQAVIAYEVEDNDGYKGKDVYVIRPVGDKILMFLAQDWNLVFD